MTEKALSAHVSDKNKRSLAIFLLRGEYSGSGCLITLQHVLTVFEVTTLMMNQLAQVRVRVGVAFVNNHVTEEVGVIRCTHKTVALQVVVVSCTKKIKGFKIESSVSYFIHALIKMYFLQPNTTH